MVLQRDAKETFSHYCQATIGIKPLDYLGALPTHQKNSPVLNVIKLFSIGNLNIGISPKYLGPQNSV